MTHIKKKVRKQLGIEELVYKDNSGNSLTFIPWKKALKCSKELKASIFCSKCEKKTVFRLSAKILKQRKKGRFKIICPHCQDNEFHFDFCPRSLRVKEVLDKKETSNGSKPRHNDHSKIELLGEEQSDDNNKRRKLRTVSFRLFKIITFNVLLFLLVYFLIYFIFVRIIEVMYGNDFEFIKEYYIDVESVLFIATLAVSIIMFGILKILINLMNYWSNKC